MNRKWVAWLVAILTVASVVVGARLHLSGDLTELFPNDAEGNMLARFVRAFGGADVGLVLVEGSDAERVERAAKDAHLALEQAQIRTLAAPPSVIPSDPMAAWRFAGPLAREKLRRALTPDGMRARLRETRALLLAPGSASISDWVERDPLRLAQIPWESKEEFAAGVSHDASGAFAANEGRARLVVIASTASAMDGKSAREGVQMVERLLDGVRRQQPDVRIDFTGGLAIAAATEAMVRRDLVLSGVLSTMFSAFVFLVLFRRARALLAVLPPLLLGTLWTTAIAAVVYPKLSAIAVAFTAVVVGVGVDTGVHVYAALLEGRRQGLSPEASKHHARAATWRPTLTAAVVAGVAFGSLTLSNVPAMRQLGALSGVGEVLTAIAILVITPEIGARLERGPAPPALVLGSRWARWVSSPKIARGVLVAAVIAAVGGCLFAAPRTGDNVVALRPKSIQPLATYDRIYELFGGSPGQWVVVSPHRDADTAQHHADLVAERLERAKEIGDIEGFDALSHFVPAVATTRMRFSERDKVWSPETPTILKAALADEGFEPTSFQPALHLHAPVGHTDAASSPLQEDSALSWLQRRHVGFDTNETLAVTYVRPSKDLRARERVLSLIRESDPSAVVTGYARLEDSLHAALAHDLPRIALFALVVVVVALARLVKTPSHVALALFSLLVSIALVFLAMRALSIRFHIYDALVLPVLLGITLDEVLFLLFASGKSHGEALVSAMERETPLVATTALTTAAGFGALVVSHFDGLRDLGVVGAAGSIAGLVAALAVVPAGLALRKARP